MQTSKPVLDHQDILNWLLPALAAIGVDRSKVKVEPQDGPYNHSGAAHMVVVDNTVYIEQHEDLDGSVRWFATRIHWFPSFNYEQPDDFEFHDLHEDELSPAGIAQVVATFMAKEAINGALENAEYDRAWSAGEL